MARIEAPSALRSADHIETEDKRRFSLRINSPMNKILNIAIRESITRRATLGITPNTLIF
ncbi:MAG: hypothetical protein A2X49_07950 [Lentisphaerae bacterium GWF2_52_8]|nr:MAG: hypothetical protein A2X49_07950 [Lentisphaerae bacterium GWF2_52_8]